MLMMLLAHLPLAIQILSLHALSPLIPNACPGGPGCTGGPDLGSGFINIADYFARWVGPICGIYFVFEGYHYLTSSDDPQKAAHAKRAIGSVIVGAIFVFFGTVLGPYLATII